MPIPIIKTTKKEQIKPKDYPKEILKIFSAWKKEYLLKKIKDWMKEEKG